MTDVHDRALRISLVVLAVTEALGMTPKQAAGLAADLADREVAELADGPGNIADLAREQVAAGKSTPEAVAAILSQVPDANRESVAATVRRARRAADSEAG